MEAETIKITKDPISAQESQSETEETPLIKVILVASIAAGVQFGWALQLSLLTPYVQLLGIPHTWAAFIWLCGPVSGMLVQPIVGYHSDRCTSRFGRRRPFIAGGALLVVVAVFLIGFAADLGHATGDDLRKKAKPRAIAIFVVGFWILDVANNMLQGPCRAFLADLSGNNPKKTRTAFGFFSFFMAVGNVLGYAAGSFNQLHKGFPFALTEACDIYCANLKSCFIISIALLLIVSILALTIVKEKPLERTKLTEDGESPAKLPFFGEMVGAFRSLQKPMRILLIVTCFNWIAWFPFLLFDTDWMGKEVYGGQVGNGKLYNMGVHAGSLGLMLNSVVLGFMSLGIEVFSQKLGGAKRLWGIVNILLAICLAMTVLITKLAEKTRHIGADGQMAPPPAGIKIGALALFSVLGIPLAVTYSIPFALASIFSTTTGAGQGLSLGVLNLAIVIPQMVVSVASGPWDDIFGGSNLPAFVVGAVAAMISAILALTVLPSPAPDAVANKDSAAIPAFH